LSARPAHPPRFGRDHDGRAPRTFASRWPLVLFALALCGAMPLLAQAGPDKYDEAFRKYSKRYFGPGFEWRLFKAQAMAESNLDAAAKSWVGARGIMQLMPTTFHEIQSKNPEFASIDDAIWNIAAGICYDRQLWTQWSDHSENGERTHFVLGSYNAGRMPLLRARSLAQKRRLDGNVWENLRVVAGEVPGWRHQETFSYVGRIESNLLCLCEKRHEHR